MFKTDKESLEALSFALDEKGISNLKAILGHLGPRGLLSISEEESHEALKALDMVGELKLNGSIYVFHVDDAYAADCGSGNGEGVEAYLRQGDTLREFCVPSSRDSVYSEMEVAEMLRSNNKFKAYTGNIVYGDSFLGIPHECDEDHPLIRKCLENYQIDALEASGIEVIVLDSLI